MIPRMWYAPPYDISSLANWRLQCGDDKVRSQIQLEMLIGHWASRISHLSKAKLREDLPQYGEFVAAIGQSMIDIYDVDKLMVLEYGVLVEVHRAYPPRKVSVNPHFELTVLSGNLTEDPSWPSIF